MRTLPSESSFSLQTRTSGVAARLVQDLFGPVVCTIVLSEEMTGPAVPGRVDDSLPPPAENPWAVSAAFESRTGTWPQMFADDRTRMHARDRDRSGHAPPDGGGGTAATPADRD